MSSEWKRACYPKDILSEEVHIVVIEGRSIGLANIRGDYFAFSADCPHAGGSLRRAEFCGHVLTCPLHGWRFDLHDEGKEIHGFRPLRTFAARLVNEEIMVQLPTRRLTPGVGG